MFLSITLSLCTLLGGSETGSPTAEVHAIVGVSVLPMSSDVLLEDHTVIVRGDRIVALGPKADVEIPEGAQVLEGEGRYLMPALADMHVHTWFEGELELFLANGVTTVRNMFGSPMHLEWRDEIAEGDRLGPTIYTAGPIVDGNPPVWPGSDTAMDAEAARKIVRRQAEDGYDFIKVYNRLPMEAYEAIVIEAEEVGIPVMGHVPDGVGLGEVLQAGQVTIEHLGGYEPAIARTSVAGGNDFFSNLRKWADLDPEKMRAIAEESREAGVWNCPTLIVMRKWMDADEIEEELERPYVKYLPDGVLQQWKSMPRGGQMAELARIGHEPRMRFVKMLHDVGAPIVLGTDQGNPYVPAGFAVHEELGYFVEAGLTPHEALRCATYNAARCMGDTEEFGSVAVGRRADLLLLEADPRASVEHVQRRVGLFARGRWLPESALQAMLEAAEK